MISDLEFEFSDVSLNLLTKKIQKKEIHIIYHHFVL